MTRPSSRLSSRHLPWIATVLACLSFSSQAAAQQTHTVRGAVADSADAPVGGAMVVALALPDSVLTKFALTDGNGRFALGGVPEGEYLIQVTMTGFEALRTPLSVGPEDVDAGTIRLSVSAYEMDELVVSVDHVPFVNRRDTLDYNAAAFPTRANASVEELLARLPGIEVDDDGTIRAQGEEVRNVLVDGREFFGSDPTVATRNLPADAVARVQVYDRESDMAEFTGIADGEEERTINLQLREDARRGSFGQFGGGLGGGLQEFGAADAPPVGRTRYVGSFNLFRFAPTHQMAVLSGANNVGRAGFGWSAPEGIRGRTVGGGRAGDGFTETFSMGLNGNYEFQEDRWIRTSYFLTSLDNTQDRSVESQQLLGADRSSLQSSATRQVTDNLGHRLSLNAQWEFSEGHDVRLRGGGNVSTSTSSSTSTERSTTLAGVLQNTSVAANRTESDNVDGSASLTWRKRISDSGSALTAEASANLSDPERVSRVETTTGFLGPQGDLLERDVLQEQLRSGRTLSLSQRLSVTRPLGEAVLEVFGERRAVDEEGDDAVYDLSGGAPVLDESRSSAFERTYAYWLGGVRLSRNGADTRLVLGLAVQSSDLESVILDRDESIENSFRHVLPSAAMRFRFGESKELNLDYQTRTREPSLTELQPFIDDSNPTRTYVGNPDLVPEYAHNLSTAYRFFDQFSFVNLQAHLRLSYTDNPIVQSQTVDDRALRTVRPVNIDHAWSASGGLTYGRPVRPLDANVNVDYSVTHTRGLELLNGSENRSRIWRNSLDVSIDNRNKDVFDVRAGARFGLNDVAYTLNDDLDQGYLDRTFYANGRLHFGGGWSLRSTFDWRLYDESVFGAGDRDVAMLDATLSRLAMDDRVEIELSAFDLLGQNQGVDYFSGASSISEQRTRSLGRYLMMDVTYRLGTFGGGMRGRPGVRDRR